MGGDELWDLGLSDLALIGIFALVVVLTTIGVVVWLIAVPEKRPGRGMSGTDAGLDHIVRREHAQAQEVVLELDDEAGRTDPAAPRRR